MAQIDIGHEFGSPSLCRAGAALVGGKAQMPRERRLDAIAVEDFALDRGAIDNFLRYEFDGQAVARIGVEMVQRTDNDARAFQEPLFGRADTIRIKAKIRPVRKLPVPGYD